MRGSLLIPFCIPLLLLSLSAHQATAPQDQAAATITAGDMYRQISVPAHDSLGGRDTPSPGREKAAAWISDELEAMGLEPGGDEGSYIQRWEYTDRSAGAQEDQYPVEVPNVVGPLRGSDPEFMDEWVVFSAHFDHVNGPPDASGDTIYNGADDNASGTATPAPGQQR